jgi:hypothetical protein
VIDDQKWSRRGRVRPGTSVANAHSRLDDFPFALLAKQTRVENLAGLYSLIATCETNGVNPVDYLADVLLRLQTHPASRIDELLPHNWSQPVPAAPS